MSQLDSTFPSLFRHAKCADWGVAVLTGQFDGKRSYLFEDGEERTLGSAGIQLMRKIEEPDPDEQETCAHLISRLSKRSGPAAADVGAGGVARQLERFLERHPGGFSGAAWRTDKRGGLARRAREAVPKATRTRLSSASLERMLERQEFAGVWQAAADFLTSSGLSIELGPAPPASEQQPLAQALRDLLHDPRSYDYRFDR
jgi:hypothetical protein